MKVYAAGLIDKSLRAINAKLQKKLVADCRKTLHASRKAMFSQEQNSFIVQSARPRRSRRRSRASSSGRAGSSPVARRGPCPSLPLRRKTRVATCTTRR